MDDLTRAMTSASSGMNSQGLRLRLVSENIAGADVPGFRRRLTAFETGLEEASGAMRVAPGPVRLDQTPVGRVLEPGHPMADASGMRPGTNVDPIIELADARAASRAYEASLNVFEQARRMRGSLLDLLRR
ncbi:MAG: flagellar basal body rod C-terminal domain-containing protein [Pseudomonadota bacterium]